MATVSLFTLTLLLYSLHLSPGQVIISSISSSPETTNQTAAQTPPSHPPSDAPVEVLATHWPTGRGGGVDTVSPTTAPSALSSPPLSPKPSSGPAQTPPTSEEEEEEAQTVTPPPPVTSAAAEPIAARRAGEGPTAPPQGDEDYWIVTGSGSENNPAAAPDPEAESTTTTASNEEMAQFRPQAQTALVPVPSSKMADVQTPPPTTVGLAARPRPSALTPGASNPTTAPPEARATPNSVATRTTVAPEMLRGGLTANATTPSEETPGRQATTATSSTTATSEGAAPSSTNQQPSTTTPGATTDVAANKPPTEPEPENKSTVRPPETTELKRTTINTTNRPPTSGTTSLLTTPPRQVGRGRFGPTDQAASAPRNRSAPLGRPHPPAPAHVPSPSPAAPPSPNATSLHWDDLSRTLAFAWELHVYGTAGLFLLLLAGAALGLGLSPSMHCPHRGALALANASLLLAGAARAALFLVDPYGARRLFPRPAVTALYNLPLPLLVWAQASLALLAMKGAGVSLLPAALERPPLVAVLAVLQCTLLLAADLLSPALSPAVPVTLQCLSLCWGLALCLAFLCYVFPRLRCPPPPPSSSDPEEPGAKPRGPWGPVLGRVLAVCALLGALCCVLHVHATLWLYGLLGDWRRFGWGWWLVHFWARLLELAWGFSLLVLASWVFWRPRGGGGRGGEGSGGGGVEGGGGDLPSPAHSSGSAQRHTCWSKIVQSLRGKPCRKSESNGVGGGGGGGASGELPNNWAGQERPGADISKSLIRNQNPEQAGGAGQPPRSVKDSNRGRNQRGRSAERGGAASDGSTGSLLRLQALGRPALRQRSRSSSLEREKESGLSLYEFDLRPPSPIDLSRSIDEALNREHLLRGRSLFQPLSPPSPSPSPGSGASQGPWLLRRRSSDPQISDSSEEERSARTESSMPLGGGSVLSSVPSRQVTAPPTPSHQGHRWAGGAGGSVPSSVSCPASLRPTRTSAGHLLGGDEEGGDDTRPFLTPDSAKGRSRAGREAGRSYLGVGRQDDSASVSSEIIDL